MSASKRTPSANKLEMLSWIAGIGAASADALALREGSTLHSARARRAAAQRDGLLERRRPLAARPALYALTRAGLRASQRDALAPCSVSASNAQHLLVCARVAAALELRYPDHRVIGEHELRSYAREPGAPVASARVPRGVGSEPLLHRPDLVLRPLRDGDGLSVAVEVELAVKAPRRLEAICRSWARCREVAGVLYLAGPDAERAVTRAIDAASASAKVIVVPLAALPEVVCES